MPHDKNGEELQVGDVVSIEAIVKTLWTGTEACNLTVETVEPFYPSTEKSTIVLNTKQVVFGSGIRQQTDKKE